MSAHKFKPQFRRLVAIDRLIRDGGHPNCSTIGRELEVSSRTVQRDIDYLRDEHRAPIEFNGQKNGFYYSKPSWFLPSVILSEGELMALLIGRQAMAMYRGTPVAGDLEKIFSKLAGLLPDRIAVGPEVIQSRISFFNAPSRPIEPDIWRTVLRALQHSRILEINYQSPASREAKPHMLRPYHVVNLEGEWYLLAFDERWQDLRQFALSRIKRAAVHERAFVMPGDFDANDVMKNRHGRHLHANDRGDPVIVKLRFEPLLAHHVCEKIWHVHQKIRKRADGRVDLEVPVLNTRDIEHWVLSFGELVRVLSPGSLRESVLGRHLQASGAGSTGKPKTHRTPAASDVTSGGRTG